MPSLADISIIAWLQENTIKGEKGIPIDFINHRFQYDIFRDQSQNLVVRKPAQVGMTTLEMLKAHYDAKRYKMDMIYTLPTDKDVQVMVGGKFNRIIANNPTMLEDVKDKDSVEQKAVGKSMIYFRGTWTKKAAMMIPADRLIHDEKDTSKLDVIADYQARLQHSDFRQTHTFSHPSLPETGVDADWLKSDQKHWFIKCPHCTKWQFLNWDIDRPERMSIDIERRIFVCKECRKELSDYDRRSGQWVPKYKDRSWSGYWVSLLMAPWMTAGQLIDKFQDKETTDEFWNTKVLGMPYADGQSKLLRRHFLSNITGRQWAPTADQRVVLGVDTGLRLDYVLGNEYGLFHHGDTERWGDLDALMERFPKMIAVVDAGGDLIGSRAFQKRWQGRVFLCYLTDKTAGGKLAVWGKGDDHGSVRADRNRCIQLTVDEFRDRRIRVHGTIQDWFEYWLDWNNLSKLKILDPDDNRVKGYKWIRSGRDHRALATVFWRIGMMRFAGKGNVLKAEDATEKPDSYYINPDGTVDMDPEEMFDIGVKKSLDAMDQDGDWRE